MPSSSWQLCSPRRSMPARRQPQTRARGGGLAAAATGPPRARQTRMAGPARAATRARRRETRCGRRWACGHAASTRATSQTTAGGPWVSSGHGVQCSEGGGRVHLGKRVRLGGSPRSTWSWLYAAPAWPPPCRPRALCAATSPLLPATQHSRHHATPAGCETEGARLLRDICARLPDPAAVPALFEALAGTGNASVSTFELLSSGCVRALKAYLQVGAWGWPEGGWMCCCCCRTLVLVCAKPVLDPLQRATGHIAPSVACNICYLN